jgi:hypothetical protein
MRNLFGYAFAALAVLAFFTAQGKPALLCVGLALITWKGNRNR